MKFLGQRFQQLEPNRTDKNTDALDRKHYYAAYVDAVAVPDRGLVPKRVA